MAKTDNTQQNVDGDEIRRIYAEKAREAGIKLDDDDLVLVGQCAQVADVLAELDASIAEHGAMITSATGTTKVNPATVESRQQRVALAKLMAVVDARINAVTADGTRAPGGQQGVRQPYTGDGSQNQARQRGAGTKRAGGAR
ncbi:hypothetical protein [Rhodococcus sp. (in: high G+C Gram-positive bacteria)]|uniref:hypothetical protein n=1 Tax=Rhodococcus sp. TaxID=1831 RepID=UPI001A2BD8D0|nr:hypothetical protein [Rhodococcus sp. (in: high G+C Gram-positive bacteria)]MBJ7479633.1 hypothetical protein [Rhodococcus sp. (in: high G+C Gram-positive bacteria)]